VRANPTRITGVAVLIVDTPQRTLAFVHRNVHRAVCDARHL